jgi:hypothetical protein
MVLVPSVNADIYGQPEDIMKFEAACAARQTPAAKPKILR